MRKETFIAQPILRVHGAFDKSLRTFGSQALELKSMFRATQLVQQMRGLNLWPLLND